MRPWLTDTTHNSDIMTGGQIANVDLIKQVNCAAVYRLIDLQGPISRVKIAELMLKEADIKNKSKIVELQMNNAKSTVVDMENEFLQNLNQELANGNR